VILTFLLPIKAFLLPIKAFLLTIMAFLLIIKALLGNYGITLPSNFNSIQMCIFLDAISC